MKISFKGKVSYSKKNNEERYYMVGIADDKIHYKNYITLQKAFEFDELDVDAGMNSYYFEVNGQNNSGYKCCDKIINSKDRLLFILKKKALGDIEAVEVDISSLKLSSNFEKYLQIIADDILEKI